MKILVVDDSKTVQAFVSGVLAGTHVDLLHASDGMKAIETLKIEKVDIVLLDWEMPLLTGPQTLIYLHDQLKANQFSVIMMTTHNSPDEIAKMFELGVSEFIMKPFTKDILLERVKTVMATRQQQVGHSNAS